MSAVSIALLIPIAVVTARRVLLLAASATRLGAGAFAKGGRLEPVTVVIPAKEEQAALPGLRAALERLDYPSDLLSFVVVNDGSSDQTGAFLDGWADEDERVRAVHLDESRGKARALNRGIEIAESELVLVCDADLRPRATAVRALVDRLADPRLGGVGAYVSPANANHTLVSRYAALESWVHQLITSAGKDALALNPPVLGAAAFRISALAEVGGFASSAPGEDVRIGVELTRRGWRTGFCAEAVLDNDVAEHWRDYWRQHLRWGRNVMRALRRDPGQPGGVPRAARRDLGSPAGVSPAARVDMALAATGYLDRLAFAAAATLAVLGLVTPWLAVAYLAGVSLTVTAAVARAAGAAAVPGYLATAALFFAVDVFASAAAIARQLSGRPHTWQGARTRPDSVRSGQ